ncbi:aldo/keto reductase [Anaerolineales bacterium]
MEYRLLGKTGVKVSSLCFGTMSFGDTADEKDSAAMFKRCREVGINFFDCANVYAGGRSEEILGRLIADCRDELIITSKVSSSMGSGINEGGMSRRHIVRAVEASLKRLNTDRIDVYFIHKFDPLTPIESVIETLDDLQKAGKIIYPAVSNWAAWQIMKGLGIAAKEGLASFACMQPMYNLVKRQAEVELLPLAASEQIGVIPYSPLGGGLLSGKYTRKTAPDQGRIVDNPMYAKRYGKDRYYQIAEDFTAFANQLGVHPVTLAVAWVNHHPQVSATIIGARNIEQLEPALEAADFVMDAALRASISALSDTPPPAHDRLEEQA